MKFLKALWCLFVHRNRPGGLKAERVYILDNDACVNHVGWRFHCVHCKYTWLEEK